MDIPTAHPTRTQRRTEDMRRRIVQTAAALLAEKGLDALTADAVANRADIALQTVYNRVGGRTALLAEVTALAIAENRKHMDVAYAEHGTPQERLERAAQAYAAFALESPHLFRLLVSPPDDTPTFQLFQEQITTQNAKAVKAYRDGIADGTLRADLDAEEAVTAIWAMFNGVLSVAVRTGDGQLTPAQQARLLEVVISILRQGLVNAGASSQPSNFASP